MTGCWVECRAADNFTYFFDVRDLIYTYVKTRCCSNDIPWIAWIFSCGMLLGARQHCIGPRLHKPLTLNGTISLCKVIFIWSLSGNILAVQCCAKSIKTTLDRVFSYAKLSGASRATLHRILTCAVLSQRH